LDTETTVDGAQQLNFGVASFYRSVREDAEVRLIRRQTWILHDDYDLDARDAAGLEVLRDYARTHPARIRQGDRRANPNIGLLPRGRFVEEVLFRVAAWPHAAIVGANLPFDLSRIVAPHLHISADAWEARTGMERDETTGELRRRVRPDLTDGGFSLPLVEQLRDGAWVENRAFPRVKVKKIGRGKAFIAWGRSQKHPCRAHFIDVLTLAGALSGKVHSLESACRELGLEDAFGGRAGKRQVQKHGRIEPEYVDYCREDEEATAALLARLLTEHQALGIRSDPASLYSGASVAGDLLDRLGIPRRSDRGLGREALGAASAAYFGGRAECRVRHVPVPVIHTDVVAEYPAVSALLGVQRLLLARRVRAVEEDPAAVEAFLRECSLELALDPETWKGLLFLALVEPRGDLLPVRARWGGQVPGIGQAFVRSSAKPLWCAGPDLLASALRVGWRGRVVKVLRLEADPPSRTIRPVSLGRRSLNLAGGDDLYVSLVDERERFDQDPTIPEAERGRWRRFFKIVANSLYGKTAEANPIELPRRGETRAVTVLSDERFMASVERPEVPGPFSFMPIATLTTAGGRLLLALIERMVTDFVGWWAFADTDSFAIAATEEPQLFPCPGGQWYPPVSGGEKGIRTLGYAEVDWIIEQVNRLNPFDRGLVPSLLELEDVNHEGSDRTRPRHQLYYFGIGAKRYTFLSRLGEDDTTVTAPQIRDIIDPSRHVIGTYADPNPAAHGERWDRAAQQAWRWIIERLLGGRPATPEWFSLPAVADYHVATPRVLQAFRYANDGRPYAKATKPFSFLLTAEPSQNDDRWGDLRLAAPFRRLPEEWAEMPWWNVRAKGRDREEVYRLRPPGETGELGSNEVLCRTYREVVASHSRAPERKSDDRRGKPAGRSAEGVLIPPIVDIGWLSHVGKEMNDLDEIRAGVRTSDEALLTYRSRGPSLEAVAMDRLGFGRIAAAAGVPVPTVRLLARGARTSPALAERIRAAAAGLMRDFLERWGDGPVRGSQAEVFLQFATSWSIRIGRVAALFEEASGTLDYLSEATVPWVAEMAFVHPSTVRTAKDPYIRADIVWAICWAIERAAGGVLNRFVQGELPTRRLALAQERESGEAWVEHKRQATEAKTEAERERHPEKVREEVRAMSDRHSAELSFIASLTVRDVDPWEGVVLQAFDRLLASDFRPICEFCLRPHRRIGDTVCERSACRKKAARAAEVQQLPKPPRGRGRPRSAWIQVEVPPDSGWTAVTASYAMSRFRGEDPLPGRTHECHANRHEECPGGYDGRVGETTDATGAAMPLMGRLECPCRCHRPGRSRHMNRNQRESPPPEFDLDRL